MYTALIFEGEIPSQFLEMNRGCMTSGAIKELDDICLAHEGVAIYPQATEREKLGLLFFLKISKTVHFA